MNMESYFDDLDSQLDLILCEQIKKGPISFFGRRQLIHTSTLAVKSGKNKRISGDFHLYEDWMVSIIKGLKEVYIPSNIKWKRVQPF